MPTTGQMIGYTAMLGVAFLAGRLDINVKNHMATVSWLVQQSLRLEAVSKMERSETIHVAWQLQHVHDEATELTQKAQQDSYRAKVEEDVYAARSRQRGDYYEFLAEHDRVAADNLYTQRNNTELRHAQILANISQELQQREHVLQELREINPGACGWAVIKSICDVVGHTARLQHRAEDELVQIHKDWQRARDMERNEYLEELVAELLQGHANKYNETANDLFQVADLWDQRAEQARQQATAENVTAVALQHEEAMLQHELDQEIAWTHNNSSASETTMEKAGAQRRAAAWDALGAMILSLAALVFFTRHAVPRTVALFQTTRAWIMDQKGLHYDNTHDTPEAFWRTLSFVVQHTLIFLLCLGLVTRGADNWMSSLSSYGRRERAVLILCFSLDAAAVQTVFLHVLPYMLMFPFAAQNWRRLAIFYAKRLVLLTFLFVIEFLLVWMVVGDTAASSVMNAVSSIWFRLLVAVSLLWHAISFQPPFLSDEASTVLLDQDANNEDESLSEVSPLRDNSSFGSTTTERAMLQMQFGPNAHYSHPSDSAGSRTLSSRTPILDDSFLEEFTRLLVPLELLIVTCMVNIVRDSFTKIWQVPVLLEFCLLGSLAMVAGAFWYRATTANTVSGSDVERVSSDKFHNLEIVAV